MDKIYARVVSPEQFFSITNATYLPLDIKGDGQLDPKIPPPYLAKFEQVRLIPGDWLLLSNAGDLLVHTLHHVPFPKPGRMRSVVEVTGQENTIVALNEPAKEVEIRDECVLLGNHRSHYHWLLDYLPRLMTVRQFECLRSLRIVVGKDLTSTQRESLELAGIDKARLCVLDDGAFYRFDALWVPSVFTQGGLFHPAALTWLRQTYLRGIPKDDSRPRRLFISRRDAAKRHLLNEDEVSAYLESVGFGTILSSQLSFSEQVAAFAHAETIVAATGSGISNSVFAPRNATVVELLNVDRHYGDGFGQHLVHVAGQTYRWLPGDSVANAALLPHNYDFRLDLLALKKLVETELSAT
jgi:capsular polysaccharide biosynthesis protein